MKSIEIPGWGLRKLPIDLDNMGLEPISFRVEIYKGTKVRISLYRSINFMNSLLDLLLEGRISGPVLTTKIIGEGEGSEKFIDVLSSLYKPIEDSY